VILVVIDTNILVSAMISSVGNEALIVNAAELLEFITLEM
jgi:predicted nucleic acid-binding protein